MVERDSISGLDAPGLNLSGSKPFVDSTLIESLETFLDGEMSPAQAEAFRLQSDSDPVLKETIAQLVTERDSRQKIYSTFERHDSTEDVVVGRLLAGVERAIDRDERRAQARIDRMRMLRYISAAAACVVFSFSAGWIGHGHAKWTPLSGVNVGTNAGESSDASLGNGTLVSDLISSNGGRPSTPSGNASGGVEVILKNEFGQVIGTQRFASREEADKFIQDVGRWQQHQQQLRRADPLVFKDQF